MKYWLICVFSLLFAYGANEGKQYKDTQQKNKGVELEQAQPPGWPWRGITIVSHTDRERVTKEAIENLKEEGVNLIRLRLSVRKFAEAKNISVDESIKNTFDWSDKVIKWCSQSGLYVLISVSDFPIDPTTRFNQTDSEFWNSRDELNKALKHIDKVVEHFNSFENVVAFEFIAEPVEVIKGKSLIPKNWNQFYSEILKTVRKRSNKYLIYTPGPWGLPMGYRTMEKPIDDSNIIYNFHFYLPHSYTHQGIKNKKENVTYPGVIKSRKWNKKTLEDKVDIVTEWANKYNIKYLYAGEFSVVRWAQGKDKYIEDLIQIFEEKNIAWSYFSFNGWRGWNYKVEVEGTPENRVFVSEKKSNTLKILEKYWKKNLKKGKE